MQPRVQPGLVEVADAPAEEPIFIQIPPAEEVVAPAAPRALPTPSTPAPPAPSSRTYQVQKGDTIWGISRKFSVSHKDLMRVNNIGEKANIRPGQNLIIPSR